MKKKVFQFFLFLLSPILAFSAVDLSESECQFYSRNGEDGVLVKIFKLIKPSSRFCIDLGATDGFTGSNTVLLRWQGWGCLLLDKKYDIPQNHLHEEFITKENVNDLLSKYSAPVDADLLCIDMDYNDFYIWKAMDEKYKPVVVVIRYNGTHLAHEDKVVQYRPYFCGDGSNYFGASILALYHLGRAKGYSLVYAEKNGMNLFFIREDVLLKNHLVFKDMNDVEKLYRKPNYGTGPNGGYRQDPKNRPYLSSMDLLNR